MSSHVDVAEFIIELLKSAQCSGIHQFSSDIHCQCPFHRPRNNITAFGVSFTNEARGFPFHCLSCGVEGNLAQLVAYINGTSYGKALRTIHRRVALKPITVHALQNEFASLVHKRVEDKVKIELPPRYSNQQHMMKYLEKRKKKAHGIMDIKYIVKRYGLYYCGEGRMAGRIIMPITINGEIVGLNDRATNDDIRNKSLHIKGLKYDQLMHGIDEASGKRIVVIVEGSFDMFQVISAIRSTTKTKNNYSVVNNMGTSFSEVKAGLIMENFEEAVLLFDNEYNSQGKSEGLNASIKWYRYLSDFMKVRDCTRCYPQGKDPGICTTQQIIEAITSKGYICKTEVEKMMECGMFN
jgi:DNA primase